jgi:hypothetical protein
MEVASCPDEQRRAKDAEGHRQAVDGVDGHVDDQRTPGGAGGPRSQTGGILLPLREVGRKPSAAESSASFAIEFRAVPELKC